LARASFETQGDGEANESGLSWQSTADTSPVFVTAHPEGAGTRVLVKVDRRGALALTASFSGAAAFIAAVAGGSLAAETSEAIGLMLGAGGMVGIFAMARAVWAGGTRRVMAKAGRLADSIARVVAGGAGTETRDGSWEESRDELKREEWRGVSRCETLQHKVHCGSSFNGWPA
jgi:hypothetical protein